MTLTQRIRRAFALMTLSLTWLLFGVAVTWGLPACSPASILDDDARSSLGFVFHAFDDHSVVQGAKFHTISLI